MGKPDRVDRGSRGGIQRLEEVSDLPFGACCSRAGGALLLYIAAANDVVSMVLVAEHLELSPEGGSSAGGPPGDNFQAGESFGDQVPTSRGVQ